MTSNQHIPNSKPAFTDLPKTRLIEMLVKLTEECLLVFNNDFRNSIIDLKNQKTTIQEREYNFSFSRLLQGIIGRSSLSGAISFHDEYQEEMFAPKKKKGLGRQIDLAICLQHTGERIFAIEGKRLYNKNNKQYVSGNTGGICRFKREQHGKELAKACIVGFMENNDFSFWHQKINSWIDEEKAKSTELEWNENEALSSLESNKSILSKCNSLHARISKTPIELFHFWVNVI